MCQGFHLISRRAGTRIIPTRITISDSSRRAVSAIILDVHFASPAPVLTSAFPHDCRAIFAATASLTRLPGAVLSYDLLAHGRRRRVTYKSGTALPQRIFSLSSLVIVCDNAPLPYYGGTSACELVGDIRRTRRRVGVPLPTHDLVTVVVTCRRSIAWSKRTRHGCAAMRSPTSDAARWTHFFV